MVNILKNSPSDFEGIKEWDYKEHFYTLNTEYGDLRIHYIDEGSENDKTVLLPVSYTHLTLPTKRIV